MSEGLVVPVGHGVVVNYKAGNVRQYNKYLLIKVLDSKYPSIDALIGCKVLIRDSNGNEYRGKIVKVHSRRNNLVVARMRRGIPGQLLGVDLIIK